MSSQAIVTLVILGATLVVLASQRIRPDLEAVCATLALILTHVLSPDEAFSALGQSSFRERFGLNVSIPGMGG